jgi:heptosyltransferase-2
MNDRAQDPARDPAPSKVQRPHRLLVVLPSWVGDAVMATPALRLLRGAMPGAFIGALARPGIDDLLAGTDLLDEVHVDRARGVMGPKLVAGKLRPRRYDAALLLTNSFSSALITRLAGIPRRTGYDRDARGLLLTQRLTAPRRPDGAWLPVPAAAYYWNAAHRLLEPGDAQWRPLPREARLELAVTDADRAAGAAVLERAGASSAAPIALLNPGGNNPAKRWPPDRFVAVARHLMERHLTVLVSGSPAEAALAMEIVDAARRHGPGIHSLPEAGITLGALKAILAGKANPAGNAAAAQARPARLMVTNDTGPRHLAAALGIPVITLFGPTDHRWTTIPAPAGQIELLADPTLPETEVADNHPQRCSVDRITVEQVLAAADELLGLPQGRPL